MRGTRHPALPLHGQNVMSPVRLEPLRPACLAPSKPSGEKGSFAWAQGDFLPVKEDPYTEST